MRRPLRTFAVAALSLSLAPSLAAALPDGVPEAPMLVLKQPVGRVETSPPPMRIAAAAGVAPLASLPAAAVAERRQMAALWAWNDAGRRPLKDGFTRPLPETHVVALHPGALSPRRTPLAGGIGTTAPSGNLVWGMRLTVDEAWRLRLHLEDVHLPTGTRFWLYDGGRSVGPFGLELLGPRNDLWTPSFRGPQVSLEMELPAGSAKGVQGFVIREVAELFPPQRLHDPLRAVSGAENVSCLVDAACVTTGDLSQIDAYRKAVAQLIFMDQGSSFVCTGSLLNDTDTTTLVPYLLTASHCFSNQTAASSLEATWDYTPPSCGGAVPEFDSLPKTNGSTLLASSILSDFTLVRLSSLPANRALLGWTADSAAVGPATILHRLSHPFPNSASFILPQRYSRTQLAVSPYTCGPEQDGRPLDDPTKFFKEELLEGGTFGGSSGAPVVIADSKLGLAVVGQLFGACGPDAADGGCEPQQSEVDGAFFATFPQIAQFLAPDFVDTSPCVADDTTLCLSGGRFEVRAAYRTRQGTSGDGKAHELTPDTGYFTFFNESNVEVILKLLNACSFADHFWVFASGLTNVQVEITVRDSKTGTVKPYLNPLDQPFQPIQDTSAFETCP